jgi:hypothetical protein
MIARHTPTPAYDTSKPYSELLDDYGACSCTSSTIEADEAIRAKARRELEARLHALGKIAVAHHKATRETIPALVAGAEAAQRDIANALKYGQAPSQTTLFALDAAIKAAKREA